MVAIRHKKSGTVAWASQFNTSSLTEILVQYDTGEMDSDFKTEWEVRVGGGWKDMRQAFKDHDLITDNYNTRFFEPGTPEDRERGYTL